MKKNLHSYLHFGIKSKMLMLTWILCFSTFSLLFAQQSITIKGTVADVKSGEALPGVNIKIVGTLLGTITDMDGKFSLSVPAENSVLRVSFIGYIS